MKLTMLWLTLNLAGALGFLYLSSRTWPTPEDHVYWAGDAFYVLVTIAPLLLSYIVLNSAVLFIMLRSKAKNKQKSLLKAWAGVAALWLVAVGVDVYMLRRIPFTDGSELGRATEAQRIAATERSAFASLRQIVN